MRIGQMIVLLAMVPLAFAVAGEKGPRGELEVTVTGFRSDSGDLAIALFGSASDYQQQSNAIRRAWLDVDGNSVTWHVSGLPTGEYAVIVYHDENGNGALDFRAFGMPKEPVGVSNNARGVFGPPRFNAAKFEVLDGDVARQQIRLR